MGRNKALMDFRGKPLIQRQIELLSPHFKEVIVGANDPAPYAPFGVRAGKASKIYGSRPLTVLSCHARTEPMHPSAFLTQRPDMQLQALLDPPTVCENAGSLDSQVLCSPVSRRLGGKSRHQASFAGYRRWYASCASRCQFKCKTQMIVWPTACLYRRCWPHFNKAHL